MPYNDQELAVMSAAVQSNMREPGQSPVSFKQIVSDFGLHDHANPLHLAKFDDFQVGHFFAEDLDQLAARGLPMSF
jgi:hypothetical protein